MKALNQSRMTIEALSTIKITTPLATRARKEIQIRQTNFWSNAVKSQ